MTPASPRRRWFQFGLRTMFVVVTVFAIWLAFIGRWVQQRKQFVSTGPVGYRKGTTDAPWPLRVFGVVGIEYLDLNDVDAGPRARELFPEANLSYMSALEQLGGRKPGTKSDRTPADTPVN